MAIAPLKQNPNPEQIAVNLIGRTVAQNKGPGIDESASVMNATPKFFSARTPPPVMSSGLGQNLDVRA